MTTLELDQAREAFDNARAMRSPLLMAERFSKGTWQRARHLAVIDFEFRNLLGDPNLDILIVKCPVRHGKLLADDTPVWTPDGWKAHGDLQVGSRVYAIDGSVANVIGTSDKQWADCEVEFSDGEIIKCHENHEWVLFDRKKRGYRTIETKQLFEGVYYSHEKGVPRRRYTIDYNEPCEGHDQKLPLDPYWLGVWLGDGKSSGWAFCGGVEDSTIILAELARRGMKHSWSTIHETTGVAYYGFSGLPSIAKLGFRDNKHIPESYLTANKQVRLEVLRGLVDTDGHVEDGGRVRIVNVNKRLIDDIETLVRSFGWRSSVTFQEPSVSSSGIEGRQRVYTVQFVPRGEVVAFLPRKQKLRAGDLFRNGKPVSIKSVRRVDPSPGHCIEIDHASKLYLCGKTNKPTHNSEYLAHWAPAWFLLRNPYKKIILSTNTATLANNHSRWVRDKVHELSPMMGLAGVDPNNSAVKNWRLEKTHGSCLSAGVEGSIPGFGADLLIIDDYMKNAKAAYSQRVRDSQWDWFQSTSSTRLEPGGKCVLLCCLAGDSMISMADGTAKKIKDLLPGETVKSFDAGQCVSSNIINHAKVGQDDVFRVRLESGISIVGNARHPFLVESNGELKWVRLKNLNTEMKIVTYRKGQNLAVLKDAIEKGIRSESVDTTITKTGVKEDISSQSITESGRERLASGKGAKNQLSAEVIAQATIQKNANSMDRSLLVGIQNISGTHICGTDTGLEQRTINGCLKLKAVAVRFVSRSELKKTATSERTSASITATKLERSEVCYVHSAISPQDTLKPVPPPLDSLNTSEFTSERIVSIDPAGFEDVYDIEVENTGSFIANGMVTHNTQWHPDDLIGRIEKQKDELELRVRSITLQALREGTEIKDPLGRAEGEALWPERWPAEVMERRKKQAGHWWDSIYQGNPKGSSMSNWPESYFQNIWAQDDEFPDPRSCYLSASFLDPSKGKNTRKGDYQAMIWIGYHNGLFYVDSHIDRMPVPQMLRTYVQWNRDRRTAFVGIEANAWQDLLAEPYRELCQEMEYNADPPNLVNQTVNKNVRIERLGKWFSDRRFRFKRTASNEKLIEQCKAFPYGDHDDGPDSFEACLAMLCRSVDALHGLHEVTETEV